MLHIFTLLGLISMLDFWHSNGCEVVSHDNFNLYFLDDQWCLASFHMLIGYS